jgi:hypothetical protein
MDFEVNGSEIAMGKRPPRVAFIYFILRFQEMDVLSEWLKASPRTSNFIF